MRKIDSVVSKIVAMLRRKIELAKSGITNSDIVIYSCQIEQPKMTEEEAHKVAVELKRMGILTDVITYIDDNKKPYLGWQFDRENVHTYLDKNRLAYSISLQ